jgi:hypothetical protein
MPQHTIDDDEGNLVLVLSLAEAKALFEEPLGAAVGFGKAFVICPHCADILSRDLDDAGRACTRRS